MRILIVEDSKIIRRTLEATVGGWGHEVSGVASGEEAWELIQREAPQLVITDWMMQGMDGPTLCRHVRESIQPHYVYLILLTALDDTQSLVDGMRAGADDFLRKPVNYEELRARVSAGERIVNLEQALQARNRQLVEISDQLRAAHGRIQRDLVMAGEIQRNLLPLPNARLSGIRFDRLYCPSTEVSGDTLNYFRLDERHIGFYSIDVSGHGIAAAMMSVTLNRLLSPDMNRGSPLKQPILTAPYYKLALPPSEAISTLNLQYQDDSDNPQYFTMVYGVVDTSTHTVSFCQAGHPSPVYLPAGAPARFLGGSGFPVGMLPMADYTSITLPYHSGDRLFLYSDGITECRQAASGEMFGSERLLEFFESARDWPMSEVLDRLGQRMHEWNGGDQFEDDLSVLGLEVMD